MATSSWAKSCRARATRWGFWSRSSRSLARGRSSCRMGTWSQRDRAEQSCLIRPGRSHGSSTT
eukprot:scaffold6089_cov115-Pinguiococcus_pyrenoidosus.AAC.1